MIAPTRPIKLFYIAWLTFHEARRRRLLAVGSALAIAFLALYAVGFYFLRRDLVAHMGSTSFAAREMTSSFTLMGLYAVNFLVVMISVLTSVDTISGEIASHSIQSIVTKPLRRWEVILGKWLGLAIMIAAAVLLLGGGVLLIGWAVSGTVPERVAAGLGLMVFEGWILLTLTLLGGTLFSTLTNGILAFMLFGLAFLGSWTEQFGSLIGNETAVRIGILSSLLLPTEAIWRRAAFLMEPTSLTTLAMGPFATGSIPSPAMMVYAALYALLALAASIWLFGRRDL